MANQAFPPLNPPFSRTLLKWDLQKNDRAMPWKGEKDPYKIWISEIILQQTRVEQGMDYYRRFLKEFPTVKHLARAKDEKVFKIWEGLGYYSRCRNLLSAARYIVDSLDSVFPSDHEGILSLKGVGPYTAAAISSFAYDLPYAVVDGNVFRVLARITGSKIPTDSAEGKKWFGTLAQEWLDKKYPGKYNQAIMDFGATVCKPQQPLCNECPFKSACHAFQNELIGELPVKEKKQKIRQRYFYYFILIYKKETAIQLREKKDIWQGLYEFPLIETTKASTQKKLINQAEKEGWLRKGNYTVLSVSPTYKQLLSHQKLEGHFIEIQLSNKPKIAGWQWVGERSMGKLAFPRFINDHLESRTS